MEGDAFKLRVSQIDWKALEGAYGASDGSVRRQGTLQDGTPVETVLGDVPLALLTLADERDSDSDRWANAMDDLYAHVNHQGDIHEVTGAVVSLIFDLLSFPSLPPRGRRELAGYLVSVAESAHRYEASASASDREIARRVSEAFEINADSVVGWLVETPQEAVFLAVYNSRLRARILNALERVRPLPYVALVALSLLEAPPGWAQERAVEALGSEDELAQLAAAAFIARRGEISDALVSRLEPILVPEASAKLVAAIDLPIQLEIPPIRAPFQGALIDATVLFSGPKVTVARTADGKNVTLHWPNANLSKGHSVRVGMSPHGDARVVEWTTAEGREMRVELSRPEGDRGI